MRKTFDPLLFLLLAIALAIRTAVVFIPGNSITTPWSGGGDMYAYVLLARNIASGNGYTYAHFPTAFRTPGYPLFLAGTMKLFGGHFLIWARILQGLAGLAAAYLCMRAARIFFNKQAGKIALLAALFSPTLTYFSGEILTEGLTSFFFALFLWTFAEDSEQANWKTAVAMGSAIGFGAMFRANLAILGVVALTGAWLARPVVRAKRELALIPLFAGLIVVPWIARNWVTFGRPLLSTESGAAVLVSLVNPEARLKPGWNQEVRAKIGYVVPNDLETNGPERLAIGSELEMNQVCWQASQKLWHQMNLTAKVHWIFGKWIAFWLSTDQLLYPGAVSPMNRLLHVGAVLFFWGMFVMAGAGWWVLRKTRPNTAMILLSYAVLITILHTPFVMNSRIRAPLVDPLVAILAGGVLAGRRTDGLGNVAANELSGAETDRSLNGLKSSAVTTERPGTC
jgi:4-amino-4-deoxy-L-arabinose transferase-like glycosyltransferase